MVEGIVLGIIQGVTEWLPISSEGIIVLVKSNFFNNGESIREVVELALFLHLGTFFAATWYLRDDVFALLKLVVTPHRLVERGEGLLRIQGRKGEMENIFRFLVLATFISGVIGFFLIEVFLPMIEVYMEISARVVTGGVGVLLVLTGILEFQARQKQGRKDVLRLRDRDAGILGIVQGFSALPGFSRSGLTISALLLRKFDETTALRVSFLMSIPVVLGGNILLNVRSGFHLDAAALLGFVCAFVFGIATIHIMFKVARKVNFAYFVLFFGVITIGSAFFV